MHPTSTSKFISYLLRHDRSFLSSADPYGWVPLASLIERLALQGMAISAQDIIAINENSSKRRWEIEVGGNRIRATHGHSVPVAPPAIPTALPDFLFHGTACKSLSSIMRTGLFPMSRQFVHLSSTYSAALDVGRRHGSPFVIHVNTFKMAQHRLYPFCSSEGVWLAPAIPPSCLLFGGWERPSPATAGSDLAELQREVAPQSPIFPLLPSLAELLTMAPGSDDRLFEDQQSGRVYEIHLTYSRKVEDSSVLSESFASLDDWIRTRLDGQATSDNSG